MIFYFNIYSQHVYVIIEPAYAAKLQHPNGLHFNNNYTLKESSGNG